LSNALTKEVRDKLDAGVLPHDDPLKLWVGGIGSGKPCTACEKPILPSQTEYEIEYYDERPAIRLRVGCHTVWEAQRKRLAGNRATASPADVSSRTSAGSLGRVHGQEQQPAG
jgi:hypothetical protein